MKKLLFLVAGAMLAFTASAQSAPAAQSDASTATVQAATETIVERDVYAVEYDGSRYVFFIVMHQQGKFVVSVDQQMKIYKQSIYGGEKTDATNEVLVDSNTTFDTDSREITYSVTYKLGYNTTSHQGGLQVL